MNRHWQWWALLWLLLGSWPAMAAGAGEREDWTKLFRQAGVSGTLAVVDHRSAGPQTWYHNQARAGRRYSPASTFKIPHTLFALDAGLVASEFDVLPWDGEDRGMETWNRNQTLRSAMTHSVVWVYEGFADVLGRDTERYYLNLVDYGNASPDGTTPAFWIDGELAVSADEQLDFLQRLYRNRLPFLERHQRLVRDLMISAAGPEWRLRSKTGWDGERGWWVGWIEWPDGPVFFALHIDMPNGLADLPKRRQLVREALSTLSAWPEGVE